MYDALLESASQSASDSSHEASSAAAGEHPDPPSCFLFHCCCDQAVDLHAACRVSCAASGLSAVVTTALSRQGHLNLSQLANRMLQTTFLTKQATHELALL